MPAIKIEKHRAALYNYHVDQLYSGYTGLMKGEEEWLRF